MAVLYLWSIGKFDSIFRKLVGIVQKSEKNDKSDLFFNFEIPDVNSLE